MPTALWYEMEGDHAALLEFVDSKRLLHSSDWYLNRAMQDLLFATARAVYPHTFHRGASYYATAGLKMLAKWRQLVRVHRVASVEERGLCLAQPERSIDQDVLLSVREVTTLAGFEAAMVTLAPILRASDHAVARQQEAFNEGRISEFAEWLRGNRLVPALIKGRMQEDIRAESAI
jgi:hypothetical protein